LPVQAVNTKASMQAAVRKIDRRTRRPPPSFIVPLQKA
jgi:hypothetical protein